MQAENDCIFPVREYYLISNILNLLQKENEAFVLDCGCGNGTLTLKIAQKIGTGNLYGVDLNKNALEKANRKGIKTVRCDLNRGFPFQDNAFDVIISNFVIEHLYNIDTFVKDMHRILKSKGYAIISTDNLSSWINIFALFLGYQDFSHNISKQRWIGNPLAPRYMKRIENIRVGLHFPDRHIQILSYQSLKEILEVYNFKVKKIVGVGYYPISSKLSSLDPRHAQFIIAKARK